MAVSAHDDEVGGAIGRVGQHHVADVDIRGDQPLDLDIEIVAGEMFAKIGSGQFIHFAASARYHNDFDKLSALKEGQRIRDGAGGAAAAVPAHQDAIKLESFLLDIRHDDHRAAGFEQSSFDQEVVRQRPLGIHLADNLKNETPGNAPE